MIAPNSYAIAGLGVTAQGKLPGRTDIELKAEALARAVEDAGLKNSDIDGLIFQPGMSDMHIYGHSGEVMKSLGMCPNFNWTIQVGGCSAIAAITMACGAIETGQANYVGIVYGDSALSQAILPGQAGVMGAGDSADYDSHGVYGMYSPGADHALAAQRHMNLFGTTKEQLGEIAVSTRLYANAREDACFHDRPLTIEKYLETPPLAEPLNRHDYCLLADGGTAFIVTTAERARELKPAPVYISGLGSSLSQEVVNERTQYENIGCARAGAQAFGMAGITPEDIDFAETYDCFTITVLLALEGYGFAPRARAARSSATAT